MPQKPRETGPGSAGLGRSKEMVNLFGADEVSAAL